LSPAPAPTSSLAPSAVSSPAPPATPAPTSAAAPLPTQVNSQGVTIGISAVNTDPDAMDVAATLAAYFGGIDARNYQQAWDTYTSALQGAVSFQTFSRLLSTSQDTQIVVQGIQHDPDGDLDVQVGFQSHQAGQYGPDPGQTCTNWSLDYQLVASPGVQPSAAASPSYLISKVTDVGAGHIPC
jgi:eukaryotic-like serine/threonine-protein kinase